MTEFDLIQYGGVIQQVKNLSDRMEALEGKIDHLVSIADKQKGGIRVLAGAAGVLGALITIIIEKFL